MAQAGPDPLQQQSAALAQQAVQDNSKREQTGGKKKSLFANLAPYIGGIEFAVLEPILGNLQGVNPSQISIPGIINHFRVDDTSLIPNGKFARRDVMWFFDAMKQGQTKEDTLFGEKQKQEGEKSEREQLFHKSQETPNREYDEAHRPQQQGNHDNQQQQIQPLMCVTHPSSLHSYFNLCYPQPQNLPVYYINHHHHQIHRQSFRKSF